MSDQPLPHAALVRPALLPWVSCKIRMPSRDEESQPLLVFTTWRTTYIALKSWRQGSRPDYWEINAGERLEIEDVTHWTFLPPSPTPS
jgi:hypothetical protein